MNARPYCLLFLILALTAAAYLPSIRGEFVSDEYLLILNNPSVQHPRGLTSFLTNKFWTGKARGIYYRPAVIFSYALNWRLGKTSAFGYHLLNLGFYLCTVVLFFGLARKWFPHAALFAAALFAFHPVHLESVAWIPGRTDLMSTFFILGGWSLWLGAGRTESGRPIVIYLTMFIAVLLALFSKEIAVLIPLFFFISDWWQKPKQQRWTELLKKRAPGYLLIAAALVIYLWLRHNALSGIGPEPAPPYLSAVPVWKKPLFICRVWGEYLRLLFFPHPLRMDAFYLHKFSPESYPLWRCLPSAVLCLILAFALALGLARRNGFALLGLFWLLSLLPVSHIIPLPNVMAVRFLFLPSVFFALALALAVFHISKFFPKTAKTTGFFIGTFFLVLSAFGNRIYESRYLYLRGVVEEAPEGQAAHNQLALAALDLGWFDQAEKEFNWALRINPDYPEAMVNLSLVKLKKREGPAAIALLQKAIDMYPEYSAAYYNLGLAQESMMKIDDAAGNFEKACQLAPENPGAFYELAKIRFEQGKITEAKKFADAGLKAADWHLPLLKLRARIAILERDQKLADQLIQKISPDN